MPKTGLCLRLVGIVNDSLEEGHVILEHDALVVYQRHGHGDQSLQRCEYHHARAGASGPSRAIVALGGNLLAATIKLLRGTLRSTTAERDLLQL